MNCENYKYLTENGCGYGTENIICSKQTKDEKDKRRDEIGKFNNFGG